MENKVEDNFKIRSLLEGLYPKNDVYQKMKQTPPDRLTSSELSEAIKEDIRCVLFVPEGMQVEGMPKLSKQEIYDIRLVADDNVIYDEFSALPLERRTQSVSQAAVNADYQSLTEVPKNIQSEELILSVLRRDGFMLFAIDIDRRTPKMYMTALESTALALKHFPPEIITPEIAAKAVESNGIALMYVPEEIKTRELCRSALSACTLNTKDYEIIENVPFPEICLEYLKKIEKENSDPFFVFGNIKPEVITPEMAQIAVRMEPSCIQFVPDKLKTAELCMTAVGRDWMNMRFIPENRKTKELCETAMMQSIHAQQLVPEQFKSPEMYMYDVKSNQTNAKPHDDKPEAKQKQREKQRQPKRKGVRM